MQDHAAVPSFTVTLARRSKGATAALNASELGTLVPGRCSVGASFLMG